MLKYTKDYIPLLKEMYPLLSESDILRIINYGWRQFYFYNLRGCDVSILSLKHKYWLYCGRLTRNSITHFRYYITMLRRKFRALFAKRKCPWDSFYYFGINEDEYLLLTKKTRGRKRTKYTFNKKVLFKILDEAKISYCQSKAIVKVDMLTPLGYLYYKETIICNPEIVYVRSNNSSFKDILTTNTKYDLL